MLVGCAAKPVARQPLVVQAATITEASFSPSIEVMSQLESTTDVAMVPEVDGRVVKILATQGQRVKAGQPILVLDNVQQTASLDASRAEARKDLVNAERYIFLNEQGAVSTKDRDYYVTQAIQSRDEVRAKAADLGYKFVTAPISGFVNNSDLWALMDVPATQASRVRMGQPVELRSQGNPPVVGTGKVVFISPYFGISGSQ